MKFRGLTNDQRWQDQFTHRRVVDVEQDNTDQSQDVVQKGERQQPSVPRLRIGLLKLLHPTLGPGMGKVDNQDQLDHDKQEPTDEAKVHPSLAKVALGYEEGAHDATGDDEELEAPEPVLYPGPKVVGRLHTDHDERHEDEEEREDEADAVDGQVADDALAVELHLAGRGVVESGSRVLFAEGHLLQVGLEPRRHHDAADDGYDDEEQGVHDAGGSRVLARRAGRAAEAARGAATATGQLERENKFHNKVTTNP